MKRAFGGSGDEVPPEVRDYMLAKRFGWTLTEIDEQPALRCDWLLAIGAIDDEAADERARDRRQREIDQMLGGRR